MILIKSIGGLVLDTNNDNEEWCVIRLVTLSTGRRDVSKLLFTTITELTPGRPLPTAMMNVDRYKINNNSTLFFRRTIVLKNDAIKWFLKLEENSFTPMPTREQDRIEGDGIPIKVSQLENDQPWPAFGLPIFDNTFSSPTNSEVDLAPFIGSVSGRINRRFGSRSGFDSFLKDKKAQYFVARRMHVNLYDFQEYLGSAVYVSPNPIVQDTHCFMVPSDDENDERIVYRFIPRLEQNFNKVRITTFDKEAGLLTSFKSHPVPKNGILVVNKGVCMGEYGFVVTHEDLGVIDYQRPTSFIRQMRTSIRVKKSESRTIKVALNDSASSPTIEYTASTESRNFSDNTLGHVNRNDSNIRVNLEDRKRKKLAQAEEYGQCWFTSGSRVEAAKFIQNILRSANYRVIIADPYLGTLQVGQFLYAINPRKVKLQLLTTKLAFESGCQSKVDQLNFFNEKINELSKHQKLNIDVKIISSLSLHDRFLVIDDEVWFMGSSLNSIGDKGSMLMKLTNPTPMIELLEDFSRQAKSLDSYMDEISKKRNEI